MPKQTLEHLMTTLHERFGSDLSSPEQQKLLQDIESHIHGLNEEEPVDPGVKDTLNLLIEEVEEQHPQVATVVREVMEALKNMGV